MRSKTKTPKVQAEGSAVSTLTQAEFNAVITANQEIQKRNPFGSEPHRNAYEAIRKAVKDFKGIDIGDYAD